MLALVLSSVVMILLLVFIKFKTKSDFDKNIPNVNNLPIIGQTHLFLCKSTEVIFNNFVELYKKFPKIFKFRIGLISIIGLTDPDLIQKVLRSPICMEKIFIYSFFDLKHGLISSKCK